MKHIIFGGDGFLGTELTRLLVDAGEQVLVCDERKSERFGNYHRPGVSYYPMDVTDKDSFVNIEVSNGDIVYHFAARLLVPIIAKADRKEYFWKALYTGTHNVLDWMCEKQLDKMVYYTTDMVYGHTLENPRTEDHPCAPLGPYGIAKYETERLVDQYRARGLSITLFRPRLIIGHGRLGILQNLFKLVDMNMPVPTIGSGNNFYQFISVTDCARACIAAVSNGLPNENYNLGSSNPPTVNTLLRHLIKEANSRSFPLPTPAFLVKWVLATLDLIGKPIMDPEQYLIADETCVLDCSKAQRQLGWEPVDDDVSMLILAYNDYKSGMSRPNIT